MKNLDLNAMGVTELNQQEMLNTEGGGWIADAFYAVGEAIGAAWNTLQALELLSVFNKKKWRTNVLFFLHFS